MAQATFQPAGLLKEESSANLNISASKQINILNTRTDEELWINPKYILNTFVQISTHLLTHPGLPPLKAENLLEGPAGN